jgi:hypothetical protein
LLVRNAQIIKVTALYPGSFTSGDMLAVLIYGFVWILAGKFIGYFAGQFADS